MVASGDVSLVIPGRNCAATLRACLEGVAVMLEKTPLKEIIFVDDGSTDETASLVRDFPVRTLASGGRGPGAARNTGWRSAASPLIWFVDSDCVAEPDALTWLLPHLSDSRVAGVGGSYGNMTSQSLLACLIHEEIVERHLAMSERVNFLATFNVLYRRSVIEELGGFDDSFLKGQDAEFAWRVIEAGYELAFDVRSRVKHYHPVSLRKYLHTQCEQGYWRVGLHLRHRGHARGDSYSSFLDHVQPPLALVSIASLPALLFRATAWLPVIPLFLLLAAQVPMTAKLVRRTRSMRYLAFAALSVVRAFWRAIGMCAALPAPAWRDSKSARR